jgi:molybdopterin-biosynthesis enzyme MoeA-like protein
VRNIVTKDEILHKMAERRGVPIAELSPGMRAMARTVDGAECYPNPVGWAPVTMIAMGGTLLAALPGPPKEMQGCFTTYLSKRIADFTGFRSLSQRVYCTMYESEISPLLEALAKSFDGTYFKPLVGEYKQDLGLPVEIIIFAESETTCKDKFSKVFEALRQEITSRGKGITDGSSQGPAGTAST